MSTSTSFLNLVSALCLCASVLKLYATPFATDPTPEVVVYSYEKSDSPLHVSTFSTDPTAKVKRWDFPASHTGHRAVCRLTGAKTNDVFCAWIGGDSYAPGDPFGVSSGREDPVIGLERMCGISPRLNVFDSSVANASDRAVIVGSREFEDGTPIAPVTPASKTNVKVVRYRVDGEYLMSLGAATNSQIVLNKVFADESRKFLHEGDFLADGALDLDWNSLYATVVSNGGVQRYGCQVTNVSYLVVYNLDETAHLNEPLPDETISANATLITRRFEKERRIPTPVPERTVFNKARPTFAWKIEGEDRWASWFGTTYTAFRVRVKNGSDLVYESPITRLPAADGDGVYTWTAPIFVGSTTPNGSTFENHTVYTWEVALYNAKFRTDDLLSIGYRGENTGNAFSAPETFRMNASE